MTLKLDAPLSIVAMRIGAGWGWFAVGVAAIVLAGRLLLGYLDSSRGYGACSLGLDTAHAFYPVIVERPDGGGAMLEWVPQIVRGQ